MKKLTQKLVLSVITMALVVVALGTSTFAWFTLQNTATLQKFEGQVTAGEGIEVSLGDFATSQTISQTSSWVTVITSSQIDDRLDAMYKDTNPLKFIDLTSKDGKEIVERGSVTAVDALSGKYIEFDLYFRSNEAKTITWTTVSFGSTPTKEWTVDVPFRPATNNASSGIVNTNSKLTVSASQAARVSVFGTTGSVYELAENLNNGTNVAPFNSNALPADSYALNAEFGAASYSIAKGNAVAYDGTIIAPTIKTTTHAIDLVTLVEPSTTEGGAFYGLQSGYFYGKVTVRVWIEGWDADAFDALFSTSLFVSLGFGVK